MAVLRQRYEGVRQRSRPDRWQSRESLEFVVGVGCTYGIVVDLRIEMKLVFFNSSWELTSSTISLINSLLRTVLG